MKVVAVRDVPTWNQHETGSLRRGQTIRQSLLGDDAPDGFNFKVIRSQFQAGDGAHATPRHRHGFQQIRFAEVGPVNYAPDQNIPQGDIAYFPRGAYYGPQHKDGGISVAIQFGFGGEHQDTGESWGRYQEAALATLNAKGSFEDGTYVETDPVTGERRERDSIQAIYEARYEARTGEKFVVAPEGYEAPVLIHPAAFAYFDVSPGVQMKHLGCFFDHPGPLADVRISVVRLSGDGCHRLGPSRAHLAWSTTAGLKLDGGDPQPEHTYVYSPRDETVELSSSDSNEVFLVEFPRLD